MSKQPAADQPSDRRAPQTSFSGGTQKQPSRDTLPSPTAGIGLWKLVIVSARR
jgi:hypothetical protein